MLEKIRNNTKIHHDTYSGQRRTIGVLSAITTSPVFSTLSVDDAGTSNDETIDILKQDDLRFVIETNISVSQPSTLDLYCDLRFAWPYKYNWSCYKTPFWD